MSVERSIRQGYRTIESRSNPRGIDRTQDLTRMLADYRAEHD
jgi:hypothetical protein